MPELGKTATRPVTRSLGLGRGNVSIQLPRIYPRRLGLALMFLMTSRAFYFLPFMSVPSEAWNVASFLFLCFGYTAWKARAGERFLGFEIFVLIIMIAMPFWSAFMALHVFGQPLLYGVLTERTMILGASSLALLMMFHYRWIDTADVKEALLVLAWFTLAGYTLWGVAHHFSQTSAYGPKLHLNWSYIEIGFLYYGLIAFERKSKFHYFLGGLFLIYLIFVGERSLLLSLVGAYGLFILMRGSFARLAMFVPASIAGLILLTGVLFAINSQYMIQLGEKFGSAFVVATTGQASQDPSANRRLTETVTALPYIASSPVLGNGDISNQWEGGYAGVLQTVFFPADIGIFGVLFVYGALGLVVFSLQFWYMRKFAKMASMGKKTPPIVDAVVAYLIAYTVQSIVTGAFAFNFPVGALLMAFLYCTAQERRGLRVGGRKVIRYPSADLQGVQKPL